MSGDQPQPPGPGEPPPPGWQQQPPGWAPAPAPPPGWAGPPSYAVTPGPGGPTGPFTGSFTGAAHKPGAIPLRPLTLGDLLDGAFRIIRYNPKATIGAAVLVSAVSMLPTVVYGIVTGSTGGLRLDTASSGLSDSQVVSLVSGFGSLLLGSQLQAVGLLFVSGMVAHVTSAAAVGRRLTLSEAWAATHGKRWRLLGMSLLLGLAVLVVVGLAAGLVVVLALHQQLWVPVVVGLGLTLVLVVAYLVYWVRLRALAVPALMLEPVGILGALGRAFRLSRGQFWRLLGILLLVALIVGFAGSLLRLPFSLAGEVFLLDSSSGYGLTVYLLLTALGTVVGSAVLQPFQAAVAALLYVDQRIRKEAYDVELLGRAGILTE